ncbi:MAG TPA: tetratricopeptide repeat protein, partial [Rhizomicrobium sp.]|nr:tetratricopeptide repeat protein [Rhizomicrobium sp.]
AAPGAESTQSVEAIGGEAEAVSGEALAEAFGAGDEAGDQDSGAADETGEAENFLAAARRSARAAAEAEANKKSGFSWGRIKTADEERPRYLVPALGGLVILALGGLFLVQKSPSPPKPAPVQQAVRKPAAPASQAAAAHPAPPQVRGNLPTLDRVTELANGGNAIAQTIIGLKELDGDGVPANPADAAKWLERAAEQGQAVAQYRLGAVYERGQGVSANNATATRWYQLAADQGNRKAMHNLAVAYAGGTAGKKDMAEAARWFAKAAALGLADSEFNLAVLYERGEGVPQSMLDAYKWYAIAAAQGDTESKSRLGVIAPQLSQDDLGTAEKAAAAFKPEPLSRAANLPPEMADLAGN